jgi:hypothetical protein
MPAFVPTPEQRSTVETMTAYGARQDDIAAILGIDPKTLRKHFAEQIALGTVKANAKVAESLFKKAVGFHYKAQRAFMHKGKAVVVDYTEYQPPDTVSAIFWLKTRAGWSEYSPAPAERPVQLGKKEEADRAAQTAEEGTGWASLIRH